jgi:hypothetical protein
MENTSSDFILYYRYTYLKHVALVDQIHNRIILWNLTWEEIKKNIWNILSDNYNPVPRTSMQIKCYGSQNFIMENSYF